MYSVCLHCYLDQNPLLIYFKISTLVSENFVLDQKLLGTFLILKVCTSTLVQVNLEAAGSACR